MSFFSFRFIVFIFCFLFLYFLIPKKAQSITILIGNVIFYLNAGVNGFCAVLLTASFSFISALLIEKIKEAETKEVAPIESPEDKKVFKQSINEKMNRILTISVFVIIAVWLFLKLGNQMFDADRNRLFVPLGISFYSLNLISYLVDVRRNKCCAEKNCFKFLTYILFFPHIIQALLFSLFR